MKYDTNNADILFFGNTYEYLERYLPLQVGRSPETIRSYRDALTVFRRFVTDISGISITAFTYGDCGKDFALRFIEHLRATGCSSGTCNQRLAALKSYLWFASDKNIAIQSVAIAISHIPSVKGVTSIREKLSEPALRAILAAPDTTKKIGIRDTAIMVLFYDSGIRLSELLGVRIGDVFFERGNPHIFVLGKGSKERVVAISERSAEHLLNYMELFHGKPLDPDTPLFYTRIRNKIGPMSSSNIERLIQKYADEARLTCSEIPLKVYPHMFRRTRATDLYQNGVALELVSRILGHSSVNSTRVYAEPSIEMLREAMELPDGSGVPEQPAWVGNEDEIARICGLR